MKQNRTLYARANSQIFGCYAEHKIYAIQIILQTASWMSALQFYVQYSCSKLRVAYNDAFRQLLPEPRCCSAPTSISFTVYWYSLLDMLFFYSVILRWCMLYCAVLRIFSCVVFFLIFITSAEQVDVFIDVSYFVCLFATLLRLCEDYRPTEPIFTRFDGNMRRMDHARIR